MKGRYTVLVAGDIDLSKYDRTKKVDKYIVYKYTDREQLRETCISTHRHLAEEAFKSQMPNAYFIGEMCAFKANEYEEMTPEEFFQHFTSNPMFSYDDEGNAITDVNPDGKYSIIYEPTPDTAVPLFEGELATPFYGLRSDAIANPEKVTINNAVFYNAFVSEETGWKEQADEDQEKWVLSFYDRFIKPLPPTTKLKVYNFKQ